MKNKDKWFETKFVSDFGSYKASSNSQYVLHQSRLIATVQADIYPHIIQSHSTGDLLDLGCGNVPLYGIYKDLVDQVTCADWENTVHKNQYLDHQIDLNARIPLESELFDTILMSDVLEHIRNPELLMGEVSRLLRVNGKLILTVPFLYWLHECPYDYFRYTEHALRSFCEHQELKVLELKAYGGAPEVVLDIIGKCIRKQKVAKLYSSLALMLYRTEACQTISDKTQHQFPLGYCLVAQKSN